MNGTCDRVIGGQPCSQRAQWRPVLLLYPAGAEGIAKPTQFILQLEVCCEHSRGVKPYDLIRAEGWANIEQAFAALYGAPLDREKTVVAMRPAGNPEQDMYLREAKGVNNEYVSVAAKGLADPGRGCKL